MSKLGKVLLQKLSIGRVTPPSDLDYPTLKSGGQQGKWLGHYSHSCERAGQCSLMTIKQDCDSTCNPSRLVVMKAAANYHAGATIRHKHKMLSPPARVNVFWAAMYSKSKPAASQEPKRQRILRMGAVSRPLQGGSMHASFHGLMPLGP